MPLIRALSHLWRMAWRLAEGWTPSEWLLAMFIALAFGMLCMRGLVSRKH